MKKFFWCCLMIIVLAAGAAMVTYPHEILQYMRAFKGN